MTWKPKNDIALWRTSRRRKKCLLTTYVCEINAKRAAEEGQSSAARVWEVMAGLLYVEPKTVILDDEDTAYTPLTQSKEETTVVGPLPLLDNHRGYMPVSVPYIGGGALDDSDSESGSDNNDEDDVNGSDNVGKPSQSALESTVQLREGSPDSRLVSGERSNGEHDDEDGHGDSNAHSGSDLESRVLDQARSRADRLPHHGHLRTGEQGRAYPTTSRERTPDEIKVCRKLQQISVEIEAKHITVVAFEYVINKAPYVFPIISGRKIEHLQANIEALDLTLTSSSHESSGGCASL
ncbi:hypothetical protein BU17DRAFT_60375 [Hysterangium stoloniferum]|nr:hypothetical protein BU17DRAFT_60375 [Hysterangium stoloniferum]